MVQVVKWIFVKNSALLKLYCLLFGFAVLSFIETGVLYFTRSGDIHAVRMWDCVLITGTTANNSDRTTRVSTTSPSPKTEAPVTSPPPFASVIKILTRRFKNYPSSRDLFWIAPSCPHPHPPPLAILIPYRDRLHNLIEFLKSMLPQLVRACYKFRIFVIEQEGQTVFNRGALLNSGFLEVSRMYPNISCFVFHDVDKVPVHNVNYTCSQRPRQLYKVRTFREKKSGSVLNRTIFYDGFVGGVIVLPKPILLQVNGLTNLMYGWGGEDDNLYQRLKNDGQLIEYTGDGKFYNLYHKPDINNQRTGITKNFSRALSILHTYDGLTTVNHRVKNMTDNRFFSHICVHIPGPTSLKGYRTYFNRTVSKIINKIKNKEERRKIREYLLTHVSWKNSSNLSAIY